MKYLLRHFTRSLTEQTVAMYCFPDDFRRNLLFQLLEKSVETISCQTTERFLSPSAPLPRQSFHLLLRTAYARRTQVLGCAAAYLSFTNRTGRCGG